MNETMEESEKVLYRDDSIECPHCGSLLDIKLVRTTVTATVKGEYKRRLVVETNSQTKLYNGE